MQVVRSTLQIFTSLPPRYFFIYSNFYCAIWRQQGAMGKFCYLRFRWRNVRSGASLQACVLRGVMAHYPCKRHSYPSKNFKNYPFCFKTCPAVPIFALQEDDIFIVGWGNLYCKRNCVVAAATGIIFGKMPPPLMQGKSSNIVS